MCTQAPKRNWRWRIGNAAQPQTEAACALLEPCAAVFARRGAQADARAAEELQASLPKT